MGMKIGDTILGPVRGSAEEAYKFAFTERTANSGQPVKDYITEVYRLDQHLATLPNDQKY